jgi:hypothetical protein
MSKCLCLVSICFTMHVREFMLGRICWEVHVGQCFFKQIACWPLYSGLSELDLK